jgi:hypothetical protein
LTVKELRFSAASHTVPRKSKVTESEGKLRPLTPEIATLAVILRNFKEPLPRERGKKEAELTGLEPATSAVTGQRSNQLSYNSRRRKRETKTEYRSLQPKNSSSKIAGARWLVRLLG